MEEASEAESEGSVFFLFFLFFLGFFFFFFFAGRNFAPFAIIIRSNNKIIPSSVLSSRHRRFLPAPKPVD